MRAKPLASGHDAGFGMLVWQLPVRLVDVSRGGCRVEVDRHLEPGTSGQLHLEMDGVRHLDDIRVSRCHMRAGAGRVYDIGVELLRTRRLSRRSLRLALRRVMGERPQVFPAPQDERAPAADEAARDEGKEAGRPPPVVAAADT